MGVVLDEESLIGVNGLTINGLTTNGLTSNGLTTNGLTTNGLTTNGLPVSGLTPTSLAALRDQTATGAVTRLFFRYLVSCALPTGHDVAYAWTDAMGMAHKEIASGQFGLAPACHQLPAAPDEPQGVLKGQRPGGHQARVLAEAVARDRIGLVTVPPQRLQCGDADQQKCRLRILGPRQLRLRSLEAKL